MTQRIFHSLQNKIISLELKISVIADMLAITDIFSSYYVTLSAMSLYGLTNNQKKNILANYIIYQIFVSYSMHAATII